MLKYVIIHQQYFKTTPLDKKVGKEVNELAQWRTAM